MPMLPMSVSMSSRLPIRRLGDPVLYQRATAIDDVTAPATRRLIEALFATLLHAQGAAGLAAPQIGVLKRIIVYHVPTERIQQEKDAQTIPLTALINPRYHAIDAEQETALEGCLSIPGLHALVPRYKHIRYHATTPTGETISGDASGFHARVIQHECDHLDGILILSRIKKPDHIGFTREILATLATKPDIRTDTAGRIDSTTR